MTTLNKLNSSSAPIVDDKHPWLGLVAYTEKTQEYFFGRDAEISEIFTRVRENPLTILFGQSGLGKTSLLGAGLIPKLRAERYRPVLIRFDFSESAPPLTTQAISSLCQIMALDLPPGPTTLWEIIHHLSAQTETLREHPPILIFDQFEEIFNQESLNDNEVQQWFAQIADLVENRPPIDLQQRFRKNRQLTRQYDSAPSPARIVITLREDYLSHLEQWKGVLPSLMRNRMPLHRLTGPQALQATVIPGRLGNQPIISDQVGTQIVRKVAKRSDNTPLDSIEAVPPFLSLLCEQLNAARFIEAPPIAEITSDLVTTHGDDILDSYYETSFQGQPAPVRCFVEDRLVSLGGHRNTAIREDAINELTRAGVSNPDLFIDALISRRLLTTEEHGGLPRLELTHDILTPLVIRSRETRQKQELLLKTQRQRRRQAGIITALFGVVIIFAGVAAFGWSSYLRAEKESTKAQSTLSRSDFLQGIENISKDDWNSGLAYLASSIRHHPEKQNGAAATRIAHLFLQRPFALLLTEPMRHEGTINSAIFSPDGTKIVTASQDKTAQIWDAATGKPLTEPIHHKGAVISAEFNQDGTKVVTASGDYMTRVWENKPLTISGYHEDTVNSTETYTAQIWDTATGKALTEPMQHKGTVNSAVFSQDGTKIVTASRDKTARIWDVATGKPLTEPMQHEGSVITAVFNRDGTSVVTASNDKSARVWDAVTGKPLTEPMQHEDIVNSAMFNHDGTIIVTASRDKTARIWDATTGRLLKNPMQHKGGVSSALFSQDGTKVVTASGDYAQIWDTSTGKIMTEPMRHEGGVITAKFNQDNTHIVTISLDYAQIWDATTGKPLKEPMHHDDSTNSAMFSPDGTRVVTSSEDSTARIWDASTGKPLTESIRSENTIIAVFNQDSARIITASKDNIAQIWDAVTGKPLTEPMHHMGAVISAVFDKDGTKVVTASQDRTARIWDATTGKALIDPMYHEGAVNSVAFSQNGTKIVTASQDNAARIWDSATGKLLTEPMYHQGAVNSAVFSQDGTKIVTASQDNMVRIWDATTGKPSLKDPMWHEDAVNSAMFSQDGTKIVTSSQNNMAQIWDTTTGKPLTDPMHHRDDVISAVFSKDDTMIVTASKDNTARVWDAATGVPLTDPMCHQDTVNSAVFSLDGTRIFTISQNNTVRIWDTATGKPLTDPMYHRGSKSLDKTARAWNTSTSNPLMNLVHHRSTASWGKTEPIWDTATFNPMQNRGSTSFDKTARAWSVSPASTAPIPDWLPLLAEAVGGYRLNNQGVLEAVETDLILKFRKQFQKAQEKDPYTQIARWFFANKSTRPNSPNRIDE